MTADEARSPRRERVHVDPRAVDVVHEDLVAIFGRPASAQVDHRPGVCVSAAERVTAVPVLLVPLIAGEMPVIGDRLDVVVSVRIEMHAALTLISAALHHVIQMRNHTGRQNSLPVIVEIDAPGIARTVGKHVELVPRGMISPDGGVHTRALFLGRAGLADQRVREHAVATIQPTVGAPDKRIERLVRVLLTPAVEQLYRRAIRLVVAVSIGNEQQIRRRPDPHSAEADFQAADQIELFGEHGPLVEPPVEIGVFKDQDAVAAFSLRRANRVFIRLGDPHSAAIVDGHGDRLHYVGLGGGHLDREARRQPHRLGGGLGAQAVVLIDFLRHEIGRGHRLGKLWPLGMQTKVIEVDMSPAARDVVDEANENFLADQLFQIHHMRKQCFQIFSAGGEEDLLVGRLDQFNPRLFVPPAVEQEAAPGLRHLESRRGERPSRRVAQEFISADPILTRKIGMLVGAERTLGIDFSLVGLLVERLAGGRPILERARLEVQIQRLAVFAQRQRAPRANRDVDLLWV